VRDGEFLRRQGRCMSPALVLRSIGRSRPKPETFSSCPDAPGRAVVGAGFGWDGWIICSPGAANTPFDGSGTSANGSTIGTHTPIGPNSTRVMAGKRRTLHTDQCTFGPVHKGLKGRYCRHPFRFRMRSRFGDRPPLAQARDRGRPATATIRPCRKSKSTGAGQHAGVGRLGHRGLAA
jgi:hypothetical protein